MIVAEIGIPPMHQRQQPCSPREQRETSGRAEHNRQAEEWIRRRQMEDVVIERCDEGRGEAGDETVES